MNASKLCINVSAGCMFVICVTCAGCASHVTPPTAVAQDSRQTQALTGSRIPVVQATGHVVRMEAREYRETQPPRQLKDGGF